MKSAILDEPYNVQTRFNSNFGHHMKYQRKIGSENHLRKTFSHMGETVFTHW